MLREDSIGNGLGNILREGVEGLHSLRARAREGKGALFPLPPSLLRGNRGIPPILWIGGGIPYIPRRVREATQWLTIPHARMYTRIHARGGRR